MKSHGGAIKLASTPGAGTAVTCWLPITSRREAQPLRATPPRRAPPLRVLVIDDELMLRHATRRALAHIGHDVLLAENGARAVEIFAVSSSQIDVILLDLSMPQMSGRECFERLRRVDPQVPVVICTGDGDRAASEAVLKAGAAGILRKPYGLTELVDTLSAFERRA